MWIFWLFSDPSQHFLFSMDIEGHSRLANQSWIYFANTVHSLSLYFVIMSFFILFLNHYSIKEFPMWRTNCLVDYLVVQCCYHFCFPITLRNIFIEYVSRSLVLLNFSELQSGSFPNFLAKQLTHKIVKLKEFISVNFRDVSNKV